MVYKLHILVILDSFITDFTITSANVDDREGVWDLVSSYRQITLIGDKGYIGKKLAFELKSEKDINLIPVLRSNSKMQAPKAISQLIFKLRRRIETSASQLVQQLNIEKVMAKSYWGFVTRIKTKLLSYNLCYYINKIIGWDINISKIKKLVFG